MNLIIFLGLPLVSTGKRVWVQVDHIVAIVEQPAGIPQAMVLTTPGVVYDVAMHAKEVVTQMQQTVADAREAANSHLRGGE